MKFLLTVETCDAGTLLLWADNSAAAYLAARIFQMLSLVRRVSIDEITQQGQGEIVRRLMQWFAPSGAEEA